MLEYAQSSSYNEGERGGRGELTHSDLGFFGFVICQRERVQGERVLEPLLAHKGALGFRVLIFKLLVVPGIAPSGGCGRQCQTGPNTTCKSQEVTVKDWSCHRVSHGFALLITSIARHRSRCMLWRD
jgi:hypothetical protein